MYPQKVTYSIFPGKHNFKNVIMETRNRTKHFIRCSFTLRHLPFLDTCKSIHEVKNHVLKLLENGQIFNVFRRNLMAVPDNLKSQSTNMLRVWTHQCECVVAQRLRRGQQMFFLYSRLWEEHALKEFLNRMRQQVTKRGKEFVFSAVGVTAYNWESNRIPDDEIKEHVGELEYMRVLKNNTMICEKCKNNNKDSESSRIVVNCICPNRKNIYLPYDDWTVFIEKNDMIVWRRLHKSGSYEYKVYGSFNDVCADDFLNVQIDIDYRRQWDTTAVTLNVIEKDPSKESNSDIVYWEMLWPRLFANRDYVFKRRYMVDKDSKTVVLVSKCTTHPNCPTTADKYRVNDYWSHMIIKPYTGFTEPGIEFGLTYFDNPGVNIPAAVTAWVAYRAMPDFLNRLRNAAREYNSYCIKYGLTKQCCLKMDDRSAQNMDEYVHGISHHERILHKEKEKEYLLELQLSNDTNRNTMFNKIDEPLVKELSVKYPGADVVMTSPSPIVQAEMTKHTNSNYWKYLQPTYYFS